MKVITYTEYGTYSITKAVEFTDEEIKDLVDAGVLCVGDDGDIEVNDTKELWQSFNVEVGDCETSVGGGDFEIVEAS